MHPWGRHGHHKHGRQHKKAGRRGPRFEKCAPHLRHIEIGPHTARGKLIRRCMSESDLPNIANREEHLRQIVRAFFDRRRHWGRGRGCINPDQCGRRHHCGQKGRLSDGETDTNDEGKGMDGGNTTTERKRSRHHFRGMKHHMWHHGHGFRRDICQGRKSDGEKDVETQGKEMEEANTKERRHCKFHHHGCGRNQGRSTSEEGSSTEDETCRRFNKHHNWGHRHRRGPHKGHFRRWMKHGCCPILVDASTMTQDIENVEEPKEGETRQQELMETVEEIQETDQGPKSPEIQEVADNLRKSSLE